MAKVLTDHVEIELGLEEQRVIEWRLQWLRHGGYSKKNAKLIAHSRIDWRFATDLLNNCGDESLAMKILF
jgi:hypothetical protein